ncbi:MAG: hypothetical protein AB1657_01655 [Candidatus Micrarchaeota archaeon]
MKRVPALLLLLLLAQPLFAVDGIPGEPPGAPTPDIPTTGIGTQPPVVGIPGQPCEECPAVAEFPYLFSGLDESGKKVSASMAVEREGRRVAVEGATIFFRILDETGTPVDICRAYTDSNGTAEFSYSDYDCAKGCTVKSLFCCSDPVTQKCTLEPCLGTPVEDFTEIGVCGGYAGAWPSNATAGGEEVLLSPVVDTMNIPPEETSATALAFTLCLPVLAVFGLLGAAMFASGRDPFALFSFYAPRYTRGAERPIGARGYTLSAVSIINLLVQAGIKPIVEAATGEKAKAAEAKAAAAPPAPAGRVTTTPMAAEGRVAPRPGAPSLAPPAPPSPRAAPVAPTGPAAPERAAAPETRAAVLTGGIAQQFMQALFSLLTGDASGFRAFFAQFRGELRVSEADAGMGAGNFFAKLGSIFLTYMIPIWWLGELSAQAIDTALAKGVAGERNRQYCENVIPVMDAGTTVIRDSSGNVTGYRIEFVNPLNGQRVSRTLNREEGELFFLHNKQAPQRIANIYQMNLQVESNRAAVQQVDADFRRNCGSMAEQALQEHRSTVSGEARDAIDTLLDPNKTREEKLAAFETMRRVSGDASEAAVLAGAMLVAGMSYRDLAELAGSSAEVRAFIRMMEKEDFSAHAAEEGGGNLVAAISLAKGTFANILETREGRMGEMDSLGLERVVSHLAGEMGQSPEMGELKFREGTNADLARLAIAGGIAGTATAMEVAGMDYEERVEIADAYGAIIVELEKQLGHPPTPDELREFTPATAEGREIFAKYEAIERYDTLCREVVGVVNGIREAARDPSLLEPSPMGTPPDPAHIGFNSNYGAVVEQCRGSGVAEIAENVLGGRTALQDVPEEMRDRVSAYIALAMVSPESTSLASQAAASAAEGERLRTLGEIAQQYDISRMDMSEMARVLGEDARRELAGAEAAYKEAEEEVQHAVEVLRNSESTLGERQDALRTVYDTFGAELPGAYYTQGKLINLSLTQDEFINLSLAPGSEEYASVADWASQRYNAVVEAHAEEIRPAWERVHFLETAAEMLGREGGPADADWMQWQQTMVGHERAALGAANEAIAAIRENPALAQVAPLLLGGFAETAGAGFQEAYSSYLRAEPGSAEASTAFMQMEREVGGRLASVDHLEHAAGVDVVRDHTFNYLEDLAGGRAVGLETSAAEYAEQWEGTATENHALQLANMQGRIQTEDDFRAFWERVTRVRQEVEGENRETELGALVPREEATAESARADRDRMMGRSSRPEV